MTPERAYKKLYEIVVIGYGICPNEKLIYDNKYITVHDYLMSVAERGGADRILSVIKNLKPNKENLLYFLYGAAHRIIKETLAENRYYKDYYINKIKDVI